MERVCLQLQVRAERMAAYREAHAEVWPDMLRALRETGWRNYSIFLRADGLLTLYFETPSFERALEGMAARDVNLRWQEAMSENFTPLDGADPQTGFVRLTEVFNLEDQLGRLADPPSRER